MPTSGRTCPTSCSCSSASEPSPELAAASHRVRRPSRRARSAPRRKRDPEGMQRKILEAATEEFANHGYGGARVERISRRARTVDRMLYYYFGSKEKLFRTVLEEAYEGSAKPRSSLRLAATPPLEGMQQLIRVHLGILLRASGVHPAAQQRESAPRPASEEIHAREPAFLPAAQRSCPTCWRAGRRTAYSARTSTRCRSTSPSPHSVTSTCPTATRCRGSCRAT